MLAWFVGWPRLLWVVFTFGLYTSWDVCFVLWCLWFSGFADGLTVEFDLYLDVCCDWWVWF